MHLAISGLCVAWKPLTAPQAMVMKRQGKIGWPEMRPEASPILEMPSQISGIEGHLMNRHTIKAMAMKINANAKTG